MHEKMVKSGLISGGHIRPGPDMISGATLIITNKSTTRFQWAQDEHRTLPGSPQRVAQKRKVSKIWEISCDRLVPTSMNLDDLEWRSSPYFAFFRQFPFLCCPNTCHWLDFSMSSYLFCCPPCMHARVCHAWVDHRIPVSAAGSHSYGWRVQSNAVGQIAGMLQCQIYHRSVELCCLLSCPTTWHGQFAADSACEIDLTSQCVGDTGPISRSHTVRTSEWPRYRLQFWCPTGCHCHSKDAYRELTESRAGPG